MGTVLRNDGNDNMWLQQDPLSHFVFLAVLFYNYPASAVLFDFPCLLCKSCNKNDI